MSVCVLSGVFDGIYKISSWSVDEMSLDKMFVHKMYVVTKCL